jgi:hypothetical protein
VARTILLKPILQDFEVAKRKMVSGAMAVSVCLEWVRGCMLKRAVHVCIRRRTRSRTQAQLLLCFSCIRYSAIDNML